MTVKEQLRSNIDLEDLLSRLGIHVDKNHMFSLKEEKTPSCSIKEQMWNDFQNNRGGDCFNLIMEVEHINFNQAVERIAELYGLSEQLKAEQKAYASDRNKTTIQKGIFNAQLSWANALKKKSDAIPYLSEQRHLPADQLAGLKNAFGYDDYNNNPAVIFPIITPNNVLIGINKRFISPKEDESKSIIIKCKATGVETIAGGFYTSDWQAIQKAQKIWWVESPIDALTLYLSGCPAIAFLSASYVDSIQLDWIKPFQISCIWADSDKAGKDAANKFYHRLLTAGKTPLMVKSPRKGKDPNEFLKIQGNLSHVKKQAKLFNESLFPAGKPFFTNQQESMVVANIACYEDSMNYSIAEEVPAMAPDENGKLKPTGDIEIKYKDKLVAGFRVFRIDPIYNYPIGSASGSNQNFIPEKQYKVIYRATGDKGLRSEIIEQDKINRVSTWEKLGIVHDQNTMKLVMQATHRHQITQIKLIKVLGLVEIGGKLTLNDFSSNPFMKSKDGIYYNLIFPNGQQRQAKQIIEQMAAMFTNNQGVIVLTWILGTFLKYYLGFYPHLTCTAPLASGKSTLQRILEELTEVQTFTSNLLSKKYQRMRVLGNHSYAVLMDEVSRSKYITDFINLLNDSYNYKLEPYYDYHYLLSASVGMFGQDFKEIDAALISKKIHIDISKSQGIEPNFQNTQFPVRGFGEWLIEKYPKTNKHSLKELLKMMTTALMKDNTNDSNYGSYRFFSNYGAISLVWNLLAEYANIDSQLFDAVEKSIKHYAIENLDQTKNQRSEVHNLLSKLATLVLNESEYQIFPYLIEGDSLFINANGVLDYLEKKGERFAINSPKMFMNHLQNDGILKNSGITKYLEKKVGNNVVKKKTKVFELDLLKMEEMGIDFPRSSDY